MTEKLVWNDRKKKKKKKKKKKTENFSVVLNPLTPQNLFSCRPNCLHARHDRKPMSENFSDVSNTLTRQKIVDSSVWVGDDGCSMGHEIELL
jgi:hypothetical protein